MVLQAEFILKLKLKYTLIIALFRSMPTFQRRFTITPLAIIRYTLEPSQAPGGYIHRCYQTIFPGAHKVETVLSQVLILRLSEPRPTLGKQLAQGR